MLTMVVFGLVRRRREGRDVKVPISGLYVVFHCTLLCIRRWWGEDWGGRWSWGVRGILGGGGWEFCNLVGDEDMGWRVNGVCGDIWRRDAGD